MSVCSRLTPDWEAESLCHQAVDLYEVALIGRKISCDFSADCNMITLGCLHMSAAMMLMQSEAPHFEPRFSEIKLFRT